MSSINNTMRAALALSLTVAAGAAASQTVLKVHHFLPSGSNAHQHMIQPWCDKVEKESAGSLKCQIYPAMQLGGTPPQLMDQARDGVADIVWTVPTYIAGRYVKSEVFELPFMSSTARQGSQALWDYIQMNAMDEYKGIKPVFVHMTEGYLFHSRAQIASLADLKGKKIRAPNRLSSRMIHALGATPVQMPMPQVPDALSKGVVDGVLAPWEVLPATKLHEIVKYHSDTPETAPRMSNTIFMFGMNQAKYNSLTAEQKKVIDANSGVATSRWAGGTYDDARVPFRKLARDQGNNTSFISEAELKVWQNAVSTVEKSWISDAKSKGADGQKLLESAKALLAKYEK